MKKGDKYKHFKGKEYTFCGIALPLNHLNPRHLQQVKLQRKVRHHQDAENLELYQFDKRTL